LEIRTRDNANLKTQLGIHVTITMKKLTVTTLSGSGDISVTNLPADSLKIDLSGSGNITASGSAQNVAITLKGSGNILCGELQTSDATAQLNGSGNITVFASESLEANIAGAGNVKYLGSPAKIKKTVTGAGSIVPMP
jgi:DUF4097 and DUF4098 domain-containing protein YvlB